MAASENSPMRSTSPTATGYPNRQVGHRLTLAFAATLLMWLTLYFACMPGIDLNPLLVLVASGVILLGAGFVAGRSAGQNWQGGGKLGIAIAAINLIMLGSMGSGTDFSEVLSSALPWVGGFTAAAAALCALGAFVGLASASGGEDLPTINWSGRFALVVALMTMVLIQAGGVVTGLDAGFAVPDWLTTFGLPMMFYPLELMQRNQGVFVEHFHRLWGLLVGLGSVLLALHLWAADKRKWVRMIGLAILGMIIIQGVLGGAWVITQKMLFLAVLHGLLGQVVLAALVGLAAVTSTTWVSDEPPHAVETASKDHRLSKFLLIMLLIQLTLGALTRHLPKIPDLSTGLRHGVSSLHIIGALLVVGLAVHAGGRAWSRHRDHAPLRRTGAALFVLVFVQIVLGFIAYILVFDVEAQRESIPTIEVVMTTIHQVVGAILLALSALLYSWTRRLLTESSAS